MEELAAGPELVGRSVSLASRPEWGVGRVTRVEPQLVAGAAAHRVTIEFPVSGVKKLVVPPAKLTVPQAEKERSVGWLESLGGLALDDVLRKLPADATDVLGSPRARLLAAAKLYRYDGENAHSLMRWATDQTRVADPLSQWSRDELTRAFADFSLERDAHFRAVAAKVRINDGVEGLRAALGELDEPLRSRVAAVLSRAF